ncbi:29325_t:CDS:2, partial [Racocetra persica]
VDESDNKSDNESDESNKTEFNKPDTNVESNIPQMSIHRSGFKTFLKIFAGFFIICLIGGIAYFFSSRSQRKTENDQSIELEMKLMPQIFGWSILSRIPQVIKNYKLQSTKGLSLAMFFYCALGNITFCISIFIYSLEFKYLLINLPWLVGNGSALLFDCIILAQFFYYRNGSKPSQK